MVHAWPQHLTGILALTRGHVQWPGQCDACTPLHTMGTYSWPTSSTVSSYLKENISTLLRWSLGGRHESVLIWLFGCINGVWAAQWAGESQAGCRICWMQYISATFSYLKIVQYPCYCVLSVLDISYFETLCNKYSIFLMCAFELRTEYPLIPQTFTKMDP